MDDDDDHPLIVELNSLRETAARFQHEAHTAAIKLQRHSLESLRIHEHAAALEQENIRLSNELDVLRTHPDVPQHSAVAQVQELSLALRRVSDKIVLTENTLLERTSELTHVRSELSRAKHTADGAYELAARMRAREEASKVRERELELKARASEEERKMVDLVVQEYADLVRNLEGRKSALHTPLTPNGSASTTTLADTLQDGKFNLHKMLTAFSTESESLHATIAELNVKVSHLQMTLDAERMVASHDRTLLSQIKTELDKLNLEDQTAAKMVARYMKFSQASTNALQHQITTLKTRHASTIATLELRLFMTESQLASERTRNARLQDALDELCEDLARESYGRRREVALRLALLSREEGVAEFMRRWVRRARELYTRCYNSAQPPHEDAVRDSFHRVVSEAESLLSTLDDDLQFSDGTHASGSIARILLSRAAADALRRELQDEVQKRVEAVRKIALLLPDGHQDGTEDLSQPEHAVSQADQLLLTPNGNARPGHEAPSVESLQPQVADSPVSTTDVSEETFDDPFVGSVPVTPPDGETIEYTVVQGTLSTTVQDGAPDSATLLIEEERKTLQSSPATSILDPQEDPQTSSKVGPLIVDVVPIHALQNNVSTSNTLVLVEEPEDVQSRTPIVFTPDPRENLQPTCTEQLPITDTVSINALPSDTTDSDGQVVTVDNTTTMMPPVLISTPSPTTSHVVPDPTLSTDVPHALLSELGVTKNRYDSLQRAFRDCSLALKELRRTLATSSPSSHTQTKLQQHLETALARIEDYAEDARVELEIRVADEELTLRGFEMMLSVPGALVDADEHAEAEASARAFVDGTDEGVARSLDKFRKKLEDVQHDVAVVKRAVHELAMEDREVGEVGVRDGVAEESKDAGAGGRWTAWTAGLLGGNATPSRSPTPVETFGSVVTSPRLRHTASLKQLQTSQDDTPDRGLLQGLNLRIPMPEPVLPSHAPWTRLGLGQPMEAETRPGTLSAMYAVGGLRSSSVGLGVGLSGSSSPARIRGATGLGMGMGSSSSLSRTRGGNVDDTLGGVE